MSGNLKIWKISRSLACNIGAFAFLTAVLSIVCSNLIFNLANYSSQICTIFIVSSILYPAFLLVTHCEIGYLKEALINVLILTVALGSSEVVYYSKMESIHHDFGEGIGFLVFSGWGSSWFRSVFSRRHTLDLGYLVDEETRMTLGELISALGGTLAQGSPQKDLTGVNARERVSASELLFAEDAAAAADALLSCASAVVLKPGTVASYAANPDIAVVESAQPRLWFARAAKLLARPLRPEGVHPAAVVGNGTKLGKDVTIAACAVIGDGAQIGAGTRIEAGVVIGEGVSIGEQCRIYPRVVIYPGTTIGNRVILHAGVVLGADGFGYVRDAATGTYTQFPQQGTLAIEDDVEIGANCTVDRGALAETRVRRGAKFDNLIHVGHNCDIGEDVILVALTGISGSSTIGKGAVLAGQVGIGDHVHVGPGVILGGQAGVFSGKTVTNEGLKPGTVHWGTPARPLQQVLREQATLARMAKRQKKAVSS